VRGHLRAGALAAAAAFVLFAGVGTATAARVARGTLAERPGVVDLMQLRGHDYALIQARRGARIQGAEPISQRLNVWRLQSVVAAARGLELSAAGIAVRIEPDRTLVPSAARVEPLQGFEWWRTAVGADRAAPPGPGKPVAVIDTGLDVTHPEFRSRPNTNLLNPQSIPASEDEEHGTMVSSVVAAPDNGVGLLGVYPGAVLNEYDAGPLLVSDAIEGIERAIDRGPGVLNMSFGFNGYEPMLADEIDIAFGTGSLPVAAAGNDFLEGNREHSPASLHHVLTIAATNESNRSSSFSNRSLAVDLSAPGENIPVAVPTWADPSGYLNADGTSFSSPIVAGAAAWVWTARPNLHVTQLFDLMRWSAVDIEEEGYDEDTGFGLLTIPGALAAEAPPVDPHEPNEDIYEVVAGKLFRDADTALTSPKRGRATLNARLDITEDPEDVYRVWVPAKRRVTVRVVPDDDVDLDLWDRTTPSVFVTGAQRHRHLLSSSHKNGRAAEVVTTRNRAKRGVYVFLDVYLPENGPSSANYRAVVTTTR
jgi:Subtilase family